MPGSMQDIYTAIISLTQSFNNFVNKTPVFTGNITAVNNLTAASGFIQVIGSNAKRNLISFHNPGTILVYVTPSQWSGGVTSTPSLSALGGTFEVVPGDWITIAGDVTSSWLGCPASGVNQPLTVMDS
jgi:hypothetical protein